MAYRIIVQKILNFEKLFGVVIFVDKLNKIIYLYRVRMHVSDVIEKSEKTNWSTRDCAREVIVHLLKITLQNVKT